MNETERAGGGGKPQERVRELSTDLLLSRGRTAWRLFDAALFPEISMKFSRNARIMPLNGNGAVRRFPDKHARHLLMYTRRRKWFLAWILRTNVFLSHLFAGIVDLI